MLRKIRKMLKHQEGFTLVELMIVVVILGILAGVGIQQYTKVQTDARNRVEEANKKMIVNAINMYRLMNENEDPSDMGDLEGYGIEPSEEQWKNYSFNIGADGTITITIEPVDTP